MGGEGREGKKNTTERGYEYIKRFVNRCVSTVKMQLTVLSPIFVHTIHHVDAVYGLEYVQKVGYEGVVELAASLQLL